VPDADAELHVAELGGHLGGHVHMLFELAVLLVPADAGELQSVSHGVPAENLRVVQVHADGDGRH